MQSEDVVNFLPYFLIDPAFGLLNFWMCPSCIKAGEPRPEDFRQMDQMTDDEKEKYRYQKSP